MTTDGSQLERITLSGVDQLDGDEQPHQHVRQLGKGAMGEVYVARDPNLQRDIAVKRLHPRMARDSGLVRRFLNEVQITAQLEHPGIPPVHRLFRDADDVPSYAMKLVRGDNLQDWLATAKQTGQPDLTERLGVFLDVCDAMAYAHARGVLHRDLKPENIMVGAFHQTLIMDWGIARVIGGEEVIVGNIADEGDPTDERLTRAGEVVGTPAYMSPEQAQGDTEALTPASDQYALGLILYELISLEKARHNSLITLALFQDDEPEQVGGPAGLGPLPKELRGVVAKATAFSPDRRYSGVDALAEDVRRYLRDEAPLASPDGLVRRIARFLGKHRMATLAVLLGTVLLALLVGVGTVGTALVALEAQRIAAQDREVRLAELDGSVGRQAGLMSDKLHVYRELLQGIATATEQQLREPASPRPFYRDADFNDSSKAPADLTESTVYDTPVSISHPDIVLAPGVQEAHVLPSIHQLVRTGPTMKRALLHSHSLTADSLIEARQIDLVARKGVPLVWAYIALENGVMASIPGTGTLDDPNYDPREQAWYQSARGQRGMVCNSDGVDESGLGVLLTCMSPLHDAKDQFVGIAAVDLTIAYLVEELLDPPDLGAPVESFLIDDQGRIQVRSSMKDAAKDAETWSPEPFAHAAVLSSAPAGHRVVDDELIIWAPVGGVDWRYVVVGREDELIP